LGLGVFCEAELRFLLLFLEKEDFLQVLGGSRTLCEAEQRFSFLFLEKEGDYQIIIGFKKGRVGWECPVGYPKLGEADPGGLGACPQKNHHILYKIDQIGV
jgi:hypothetical protein